MRVVLAQVASPAAEPVARRRERVGQMLADAAGADLVVLPELWPCGYFAFDRYADLAEPLHGDTIAAAREWAIRLRCHVHLGSFVERGVGSAPPDATPPDARLHNTAVLLDPAGRVVHVYRKVHVFGYRSLEARLLTAGDGVSVADTPFGSFAATTCYDLRFPELWRALVDAGATTVAVPAAWPAARQEHWRLFTATRAVEQQLFVLACNAVGTQGEVGLGGGSRVVDPWGTVLAEADDREGLTWCEVDPATVAKVRAEFPVLADRRLRQPALDEERNPPRCRTSG